VKEAAISGQGYRVSQRIRGELVEPEYSLEELAFEGEKADVDAKKRSKNLKRRSGCLPSSLRKEGGNIQSYADWKEGRKAIGRLRGTILGERGCAFGSPIERMTVPESVLRL